MAPRKETPDVLGAVLNDESGEIDPLEQAEAMLKKTRSSRQQRSSRRKKQTARQVETQSRPRKWEYCTVTFHDYGGWRPRYIDGVQISGWKQQPQLHEYLNKVGEMGWELSGSSRDGRSAIIVFFKRPKG